MLSSFFHVTICITSFGKCLFWAFAHFKNWIIWIFLKKLLSCMSSFVFFIFTSYQIYGLQIFFLIP